MLEIISCGVEQIVAMKEGSMHSLDCPSLKDLNVYRCDAFNHLDMFSIEK
ncbi:NBS-LRR type disease resistance protein, partial [Trifolium medium]|nr:NBS-LRR type disease resistance protein [Trifolium medium]